MCKGKRLPALPAALMLTCAYGAERVFLLRKNDVTRLPEPTTTDPGRPDHFRPGARRGASRGL
jgi:hypothetical protein